MKERPIMFKAEMVRAILDGRKSQTRRPIKRGQVFRFCRENEGPCDLSAAERREINAEPFRWEQGNTAHPSLRELLTCCPYGVAGDRLWVKETAWIAKPHFADPSNDNWKDNEGRSRSVSWDASMVEESRECARDFGVKKTSAMFMPRWASRLTLEIASVRVEPVNDITDLGAQYEGVRSPLRMCGAHRTEFACLWDTLYAKTPNAWALNPWVWVVEFKRLEMPNSPGIPEASR